MIFLKKGFHLLFMEFMEKDMLPFQKRENHDFFWIEKLLVLISFTFFFPFQMIESNNIFFLFPFPSDCNFFFLMNSSSPMTFLVQGVFFSYIFLFPYALNLL